MKALLSALALPSMDATQDSQCQTTICAFALHQDDNGTVFPIAHERPQYTLFSAQIQTAHKDQRGLI